jgi:hypothetical protein
VSLVNFKRIGQLGSVVLTRFQSNVEQAFKQVNDCLDLLNAAPVKLYGSFETEFVAGLVSQDATGFSIAYDRNVSGQTGNTTNVNLVLTLDDSYKKFLFCSILLTGTIYEGSGEPITIHYVSDTISSGGKVINLSTVGTQNTRLMENGTHFLEITLLKF